jgi:hypothetical protein
MLLDTWRGTSRSITPGPYSAFTRLFSASAHRSAKTSVFAIGLSTGPEPIPVMRCDLSRFRAYAGANCGRIGPSRERFLPLRVSIQPTIPASPYNGWNKSADQSLVHYRCFMEVEMRTVWALSALLLTVLATPASAKGCLKGAVVGGAAGHYAGHHGVIGAAAGCLIGRHQARKRTYVEPSMRQSGPGRI